MSRYHARLVLEQISNRPVLIAPQFVRGTEGALGPEQNWGIGAAIRDLAVADADAEEAAWTRRKIELAQAYSPGVGPSLDVKPFAFADGKAIIPVHGMLINRFPYSWGGATGYNFIRSQVAAAMSDPDVDGIIYDVNSYGGWYPAARKHRMRCMPPATGRAASPRSPSWTPTVIRRPTIWPLLPIRSRSRRAAVPAPSAC
jgi:hypothetical protein